MVLNLQRDLAQAGATAPAAMARQEESAVRPLVAPEPAIAPDGFSWRLSVFYASISMFAGLALPFFPVWLEAKALDSRATGIVLTSMGNTASSTSGGFAVAIQNDGKIDVAGSSTPNSKTRVGDFTLVRYNLGGSLDTTFGFGGTVTTQFA